MKNNQYTAVAEVVDLELDIEQTPNVPTLVDSKGAVVPLTIGSINTIGSEMGSVISDLNDEVLGKVRGSDNEIMGEGIQKILSLTQSVDMSRLGKTRKPGIIGWLRHKFTDTKLKVISEFTTVAEQVMTIRESLSEGIQRMEAESVWLENAYTANLKYYHDLKDLHANTKEVFEYHEAELERMLKDESLETYVINDKKALVDALHKQTDKLLRMTTIAQLTTPQIRSMQAVNYNTINEFGSIISTVIPAWKSGLSLALISEKQRKDNALGKSIADETNRLFKDAAKLVGENLVQAAINNQRGIVEFETLESMQSSMISSLKEAAAIDKKGRQDRYDVENKLGKMAIDLKNELRTYSK